MGKSSFLELYHWEVIQNLAKYLALNDVLHNGLKFLVENTWHNVRTIVWLLISNGLDDLRPFCVGSDGNKEIWLTKSANNSHCISVQVLVVSLRTCERFRQEEGVINLLLILLGLDCIFYHDWCDDLLFSTFQSMVIEIVHLDLQPHVHEQLLK